jgi:hypothetical protein
MFCKQNSKIEKRFFSLFLFIHRDLVEINCSPTIVDICPVNIDFLILIKNSENVGFLFQK